jgi:membrane protein DedA with SNARE-associated domain
MIDPVILLNNILGFASYYRYPLIAIGTIFEGPILMIASGFLYRTGFFAIVPLFIAILIGDLVGDVIWYVAGRYFAHPILSKKGKFVGITPERFEKINELFSKYHEKILIFSKLTLGLGFAVGILAAAGMAKVPFKKYMIINIIGEFFLVAVLLSVGYFFGQVYLNISDNFKIGFLITVAVLVLSSFYFFSRYISKKSREL